MPKRNSDRSSWALARELYPQLAPSLSILDKLAKLPANWDAEGSRPLEGTSIDGAKHIAAVTAEQPIQQPHIVPISGGTVQLEWHIGNRLLELEILPDGSVEYLRLDEAGQADEGVIPFYDDRRIVSSLRWAREGSLQD